VQNQRADRNSEPAFFRLVVWQKAQLLASELVSIVDALPPGKSAAALGNQLLRSAGSIPANIAEGYGRYSDGAYRNHLSIARGSLFETESWIDLLWKSGYLSQETAHNLINSCEEIGRLITAMMKPLVSARKSSLKEEGPDYVLDAL
jgi:four helix bundle protein